MPRIRTIKPEFPQSESMGRVSRDARLLFILLWTIADDSGRARAASRMLASLLFPYDEDAILKLPEWLFELERQNCVVIYTVDGNAYLQIVGWSAHQKIDRPSPSKFPPPPEKKEKQTKTKLKPRDKSPPARESSDTPREGSSDARESSSPSREGSSLDQGPRTKEGTKDLDLTVTNVTAACAAREDSASEKPDWWPKRDRYRRVIGDVADKLVYDLGKVVLGKSAGGQITKLINCYRHDLRACADILLQADETSDARGWFAKVLRNAERDELLVPQHEKYPENIYRERV